MSMVTESNACPCTQEASWGVTPMEEQPEANVDDIEVGTIAYPFRPV